MNPKSILFFFFWVSLAAKCSVFSNTLSLDAQFTSDMHSLTCMRGAAGTQKNNVVSDTAHSCLLFHCSDFALRVLDKSLSKGVFRGRIFKSLRRTNQKLWTISKSFYKPQEFSPSKRLPLIFGTPYLCHYDRSTLLSFKIQDVFTLRSLLLL